MSDDDFDVELLALAGDGEKRRKKRQNSSSGKSPTAKRRKADVKVESDSDMEPESEEDDSNPYPLEGKYIDEADRARLLQMPEIEREELLATRQEEMQRLQDKLNLDHMLKAQSGDSEHVSQAAKRKHAVRGATKEKTKKLDELKAKRKAKEERARTHKEKALSPQRRRSLSSEPELSDVTDEEGEINKDEEEDRKFKESFGSPKAEKPSQEEFTKIRVARHQIVKHYHAPWFPEWITGAWVRYLIGCDDARQPIYRLCEIRGLSPTVVKSYKVDELVVDRVFELKHGKAIKAFPLDKVSDSPFTQKEFDRLVQQLNNDKVDFPSKRSIEKKAEQLVKLPNTPLTEADITAMIARKNALNPNNVAVSQAFAARAQLTQERNLALKRQDYKEAAQIEQELEALTSSQHATNGRREPGKDASADVMARVNERNRKANLEAVRKAEAEQAARKRQERKAVAAAAAAGVSTPVIFDVSARVKTVPKIHHKSRTGTPIGTPSMRPADNVERSVSPLPPLCSNDLTVPATASPARGSFEARVINSIHIELDDF